MINPVNLDLDDAVTMKWYSDWLKRYRKARAEGNLDEVRKLIKESESPNVPLKEAR